MKTQVFTGLITLLLISCRNNNSDSIVIELEPDKHLEDTQAGSFLKQLDIDYTNGLYLIANIRQQLKKKATLEDIYNEGKNVTVKRWKIKNTVIIETKEANGEDGAYITFEIPFDKEGIEFGKLIGETANELKPDRKYECSIIISSKKDNCRLCLCGFGKYCKYMSIIEAS